MMNDEYINEQDAQTKRLLDAVCEGISLQSDKEENETLELQEDDFESV